MATHTATKPIAGQMLKKWRNARRFSQLNLAMAANVSARHISFVENSRAIPSPEMIHCLSEALNIPYQDRNAILICAGHAPNYADTSSESSETEMLRRTMGLMLKSHEPNGAFLLGPGGNIRLTNRTMHMLTANFTAWEKLPKDVLINPIKLIFHPDGFRNHIENWSEVSSHLYRRIIREQPYQVYNEKTAELVDFMRTHASQLRQTTDTLTDPLPPDLKIKFRNDQQKIDVVTMALTLGTAQDLTFRELHIETFFPADDQSKQQMHRLFDVHISSGPKAIDQFFCAA